MIMVVEKVFFISIFHLSIISVSQCHETKFIKPIINDRLKYISVCNLDNTDEVFEELIHIAYHNNLWLAPWNCLESGIPELNNGIIILNQALPVDVTTIFKKEGIQLSWMLNVWFILTSDLAPQPIEFLKLSPVKIGLNAKIFIMDKFTNVGQVIGKARFDFDTKDLGPLENINLQEVMLEIDRRSDFNGTNLVLNYDSFHPYCFFDNNGKLTGIIYDAMKYVSQYLNLTLSYIEPLPENKGIWSKRFKNGTFVGMIAEVGNGLVDASATGFASTYERSEIVDFAPMIDTSEQRVIIKTPNKSDYISYLIPFSNSSWLFLSTFIICIVLLLTMNFYLLPKNGVEYRHGLLNDFAVAFTKSIKIVLNQTKATRRKSFTYRTLFVLSSIYGFIVITHYEAYLGSTLIVETFQEPFKSWSDIAKSNLKILTWHGGLSEEYFKYSLDPVLQQIYKEKIMNEKALDEIGHEESISMIMSGRYAIFNNFQVYTPLEEYPCEITHVNAYELRSIYQITIPFGKESPFLLPIRKTLDKMRERGILQEIIKQRYETFTKTECGESKVSMGFNQLQFPIGLLIFGLGGSIIAAFIEKVLDRLNWCKKEKVQNTKVKKDVLKRLRHDLKDFLQNMNEDDYNLAKLKLIMDILGTKDKMKSITKDAKVLDDAQSASVDKFVVQMVKEAATSNRNHDLVN